MVIIPAIDLKDGRCVRLRQGDMRQETVYSEDPAGVALQWQQAGASFLHVVDLNGAIDGRPANSGQVEAILKAVNIPVQVGGGIRTLEALRRYFELGVARVVLGTTALHDQGILDQACAEFEGRVVLGLDAKNGKVAVRGWTAVSDTTATALLTELSSYALGAVIYTDIARDGMLEGPNLTALKDIVEDSPFPVIASGGITQLDDVRAIKALGPKVTGAIIGKALYDGKLDFAAVLQVAA